MKKTILFYLVIVTLGTQLVSCGDNNSTSSCSETGPYACQTGATEPLYTYQWALNAAQSFFAGFPLVADGFTDLNVEAVHKLGIKGQGINVMVLDDGMEINHIDLKANINPAMTWNFETGTSDSTPSNPDDAHGTNVAGMIAAAQNGIGVMGIAPKATLGGARFVGFVTTTNNILDAYGGAEWSKDTDVFNASYSSSAVTITPSSYQENQALQSLPNLRGGKGAVMVKGAANGFEDEKPNSTTIYDCPQFQYGNSFYRLVSCANPSSDTETLELPVIVTAAANAMGYKSSYSSAGSVIWITGLGGELRSIGNYGEAGSAANKQGPQIYSTDLMGCERGYSKNGVSAVRNPQFMIGGSPINKEKNPNCDFDQMNGTSSATPTVTGVVALMLSANPNLGWRDVRDILRKTARLIDVDYGNQGYRNHQVNLTLNPTISNQTSKELVDGQTSARIDYGWQKNQAGIYYSNWYGFGLADARAAVEMARNYTSYKPSALVQPEWKEVETSSAIEESLDYGKVKKVGQFSVATKGEIDMVQLQMQAVGSAEVCMGSVGIFLKSPQGTVSILSTPYNLFYNDTGNTKDQRDGGKISSQTLYALGSYAFYGENPKGDWTVYAVSGTPLADSECA
ncbi:S8 family serine peptidase, partial [Polynucleobacter sp. IMCC30063]|uniref:S8 family serine peptidase n=1 Tax=Polynucleobacter sp. IMCC30063 TaxID=2907298 RepID=UPI001F2A3FD0